MAEPRATPIWLDLLGLLFLIGLALLPPVHELHKQAILLVLGAFQFIEKPLIRGAGEVRGPVLAVLIKLTLATVLLNHTRDAAPIVSSYWPVFFVPVTTAAIYFGPWGTLLWTTVTSAAYCSYLIPAMKEFELDWAGASQLLLRLLFLYFVAMTVNRFVMEYRLQVRRYQALSESLAEANRNLRQAQEEARRAERLAALGQLSAGLAHEIRNPLGVIKGSAEILKQKLAGVNALAEELSGFIYTEVNRLSALVSRFLDFARPSRLQLHPEELPPLLETCIRNAEHQGATAHVNIVRDYAADLPLAMIDRELCEQVFTNLIVNACEAMSEQGGAMKIRIATAGPQPAQGIRVEIEDSGPGINEEIKEQIFNPFFTTKKTGVGLGLAIVSKIVDAHSGSVKVESGPGLGACFRVTLPAAAVPAKAEGINA
ncbi:MAG TPA: ATP-binding protein [Terriglobales bacterium]|jgi:two-component system, NtrC family, sensor histidine kinase HydH|nr:ATP-binding protein [Terriglobales bacterium]